MHLLVAYARSPACTHRIELDLFFSPSSVNIHLWSFVILNVFTILVTYLHLMCIEKERESARAKIKIKVLVVNALQCAGAYKCVLSSAALVSINETTFSLSVS